MVSTKHGRTLRRVFAQTPPANLNWRDVAAMLTAFGVDMTEGAGSRVRIKKDNLRLTLHKPHPKPEMDKGAVVTLRMFLKELGIMP